MSVLEIYLLCMLDFHLIFAVYSTCAPNEFTVKDASGKLSCMKCPPCLPGHGLFPQCGDIIKQGEMKIECRPCQLGKTYSATNDIGSCQPCEICSEHQIVVRNCTLNSNSKCNETCSSGFYYEELTGDCQPCSWCCGSEHYVKTECKDMPPYQQCDVNNKNCKPKCQKGQNIVADKNGGHCEDCKDCPPGTSPFPQCGSVVESTTNIKCLKCIAGKTYSDKQGKSPCRACSKCTFGQKELAPCNLTNDRVCGECDKGFYKDDISNECKPCSACCNDNKDVRVKKCTEQKMPENLQCSYTNRAISVCQQQRNQEPNHQKSKSTLVVYLAAGVTVGLVISALAMLYWKLKYRRNYERLSTHQSLAFLQGTEEEGAHYAPMEEPTVDVSQDILSFTKSGVMLQFRDRETFLQDAQEIRLEICWDKAAVVTLQDHEWQLSPVIIFHPRGLKPSKPVQVRLPHSALVFYSHGWNITLKSSSTLKNDTIAWKDEGINEVQNNEVSFHADHLLSYVVVGTVSNSKPTKKRLQCAIFGGEGKVGKNYTAYLYVFDDCEASLEKIMDTERSSNRILLGSIQSLYVEVVQETDIKITVKQPVDGWNVGHINPQVISHKSLKESYQTIPRSEILFEHDNGRNRDFLCTFELTADNTTTKITAVAPIKEDPFRRYQESYSGQYHQMVTGRNLCDPLITNDDKPSLCLHELPKEVLNAVCVKLDQPFKGMGNWRHVGEKLGFTHQEIEVFRAEFLTPDGSPCTVMLQALQTKSPKLTIAEFVNILQIRKIQRFDVVDILEPYVYELVPDKKY